MRTETRFSCRFTAGEIDPWTHHDIRVATGSEPGELLIFLPRGTIRVDAYHLRHAITAALAAEDFKDV